MNDQPDRFADFAATDRYRMMDSVLQLPEQLAKSYRECSVIELPEAYASAKRVALLGMGGSGIPGDFVERVLLQEKGPAFDVVKGYALPPRIDSETLVFAISYSGTTEETYAAFEEAVERGAMIFGISCGDRLLRQLGKLKLPYYITQPGRSTRGSFGYLLGAVLSVLSNLRLVADKAGAVAGAARLLTELAGEYGLETPVNQNAAKKLAETMYDRRVILYSSEMITDAAALRWKQQINENSKALVHHEVFPEASHNNIAALKFLPDKQNFLAILLRGSHERPELARRIDAIAEVMADNGLAVQQYRGRGDSYLEELLSLSYLGDFVSVYLSSLYGIDPTPVEVMSEVKVKLGLRDLSPDKL